jgi:NhaP-type Na+/H+ or K+/H+ antiporter
LYSNFAAWWSWEFIIYQSILIIVGRYAAIFFCFYTVSLCFKSKTIQAKELLFIGWGGMIRGAIAFALVMRIPKLGEPSCKSEEPYCSCFTDQNYDLMVTTTFALVVFTTLVFGSFMTLISRIFVPPDTKK